MKKDIVIDVRDVEKQFRVYKDKGYTLKSRILFSHRKAYDERKVLRGISFQVRRGEAIGLIGHNGCGKSTTLKLLTRIIYPDRGTITMKGRVSSLIELGAGFHPEMSGRENIYINASIFGLTRDEIDRRLGDIIEFSELGEFIDSPVRTYSSGMYMRLAFSVAINVDADILLIDEILAVGDAAFQAKCFNRLRQIKAAGTTIVIVSHSLGQIEQFCERSIWIDKGLIRMEGSPREVHPCYMEYMGTKEHLDAPENESPAPEETPPEPELSAEEAPQEAEAAAEDTGSEEADPGTRNTKRTRWGSRDAVIDRIELLDESGRDTDTFRTGSALAIRISYHARAAAEQAVCGIGIFTVGDISVYGTNTALDYQHIELKPQGTVVCRIPDLSLVPGEYKLDCALHREDGFAYDYRKDARIFRVYSDAREVGIAHLPHEWTINQAFEVML